jgi:hypothetical protein
METLINDFKKIKINKIDIIKLVKELSLNYKNIISREELKKYKDLDWGNNGIGDRWCNKKFNYGVVYGGKINYKIYSDDIDDKIPKNILIDFKNKHKTGKGIIGIYIFSVKNKKYIENRPIKLSIKNELNKKNCIVCGSNNEIIVDHKNDLYNDKKVLDTKTQTLYDFQPLCNHCNLQKRQICKDEKKNNKLYSAKNILYFRVYEFEFPWEKKLFDIKDKNCKKDTYWYDPIEFHKKIYYYVKYKIPINNLVKKNIKLVS